MSTKALSEYTVYSRYARYREDLNRRETWGETCDRVFDMHERKYEDQLSKSPLLKELFQEAKDGLVKKRILGSQRALQFGGSPIEKKNAKIFNCSFGHICYDTVFNEAMHLLLCGCGVGFSIQKHHVKELSDIKTVSGAPVSYEVEDSIEGWANSVGVLMSSYFEKGVKGFEAFVGKNIEFDLSLIRPEGALIAGGFKAPGPNGLRNSLEKIKDVLDMRINSSDFLKDEFKNKLRPIDAYDILMHMSDAVLSGGVRRSATIALFSIDDMDMMSAKTGNWFEENPQRARSNNSVVLVRGETTKEQFMEVKQRVREFGEPAFVFVDDKECGNNPCVEITFRPVTPDGRHGFQFCNLSTINGKKGDTEEKFLQACKEASIIGTIQAGYTDFGYLSEVSKEITEHESLLGVSITGIMDSPDITLNPRIQKKGAKIIKETNEKVAELLGIRPAARLTCVKPEGSASCILGTASGIHPHHAKKYFRRVQANRMEYPLQYFNMFNPKAVEQSVWSANDTDKVITFLCEVPVGSVIKNQLSAIQLLGNVKLTQQNWVEDGTVEERGYKPYLRHNVSNTIQVNEDEWDEVFDYLWGNQKNFSGVSMLPSSGDKDYPQAPFCTVHEPKEIVKEYGDASIFASGMITAALRAFNDDLWDACSHALKIKVIELPEDVSKNSNEYKQAAAQKDWIRRAEQFADRYFEGDVRRATYCMKDVHNWKVWCDLKREHVEVDWTKAFEESATHENIDTLGAIACAGGKCSVDL